MDLDFNQDNNQTPEDSHLSVNQPSVNESTAQPVSAPSGNNEPLEVPTNQPIPPTDTTEPNKLNDLSQPINVMPSAQATPPAPPTVDSIPEHEPVEQTIETPISQPAHRSILLPLIVAILILLILAAAGAWYYSSNYINQKNNLNPVTIDPATGQKIDAGSKTNPTADTSHSSADLTTTTGRDTQRKADLAKIEGYLNAYKTQNGSYPISADVEHLSDANSSVTAALVPTYATTLPTDPSTPNFWYGYKSTDGTSFELTAVLEDTSDPDGQKIGNNFVYAIDGTGANVSGTTAITNDFTSTGSTN